MNNTQRKICEDAIQIFGVPAQLDMAVEEMSELTKEICKHMGTNAYPNECTIVDRHVAENWFCNEADPKTK